jgi:hypothetical protein
MEFKSRIAIGLAAVAMALGSSHAHALITILADGQLLVGQPNPWARVQVIRPHSLSILTNVKGPLFFYRADEPCLPTTLANVGLCNRPIKYRHEQKWADGWSAAAKDLLYFKFIYRIIDPEWGVAYAFMRQYSALWESILVPPSCNLIVHPLSEIRLRLLLRSFKKERGTITKDHCWGRAKILRNQIGTEIETFVKRVIPRQLGLYPKGHPSSLSRVVLLAPSPHGSRHAPPHRRALPERLGWRGHMARGSPPDQQRRAGDAGCRRHDGLDVSRQWKGNWQRAA